MKIFFFCFLFWFLNTPTRRFGFSFSTRLCSKSVYYIGRYTTYPLINNYNKVFV